MKKWAGLAVILVGAFALWTPQLMFAQGAVVSATSVPILMYHKVMELGPATSIMNQRISINPKKFEQQLQYLHDNNYTTITVRDLAHAMKVNTYEPRTTVALTFDDGTTDFYDTVLPLLQKFHMRATLYANPGFNGNDDRMTHKQLREVADSGLVEIAGHSMSHLHMPTISDDELHYEVFDCKAMLEKITGAPVYSFAYPFGEYNDAVIAEVQSAGFESSVIASEEKPRSPEKMFTIPRRVVSELDTYKTFIKKLQPR